MNQVKARSRSKEVMKKTQYTELPRFDSEMLSENGTSLNLQRPQDSMTATRNHSRRPPHLNQTPPHFGHFFLGLPPQMFLYDRRDHSPNSSVSISHDVITIFASSATFGSCCGSKKLLLPCLNLVCHAASPVAAATADATSNTVHPPAHVNQQVVKAMISSPASGNDANLRLHSWPLLLQS